MLKQVLLNILSLFILTTATALYAENKAPSAPYSDAVRVDNILYLSGKLGVSPETRKLAPGGIQGETRQALENIKAILKNNDSEMSKVVKCTVYLADIAEWAAMNEIYRTYFPVNPPARSAVGVDLGGGARVEIECIAKVN